MKTNILHELVGFMVTPGNELWVYYKESDFYEFVEYNDKDTEVSWARVTPLFESEEIKNFIDEIDYAHIQLKEGKDAYLASPSRRGLDDERDFIYDLHNMNFDPYEKDAMRGLIVLKNGTYKLCSKKTDYDWVEYCKPREINVLSDLYDNDNSYLNIYFDYGNV